MEINSNRDTLEESFLKGDKRKLEYAVLSLWSAVDKIIKHLEENEKA